MNEDGEKWNNGNDNRNTRTQSHDECLMDSILWLVFFYYKENTVFLVVRFDLMSLQRCHRFVWWVWNCFVGRQSQRKRFRVHSRSFFRFFFIFLKWNLFSFEGEKVFNLISHPYFPLMFSKRVFFLLMEFRFFFKVKVFRVHAEFNFKVCPIKLSRFFFLS